MQIINIGHTNIEQLWYNNNIGNTDCYFKASVFLLERKESNRILLCNTVTGELVFLSEEETRIFKRLPGSIADSMSELVQHKFIVPLQYDEVREIGKLKKILRYSVKNPFINKYNILPTTRCNAQCFYCYQNSMPRMDMSDKIAEQLIEFINIHSDHVHVHLSWFGGEPLIGVKQINHICDGLTEKGIRFISIMTSNCLLFSKELVLQAKNKWHLKSIQVTLDGTENVYNQTKSYIGYSSNPYKRVNENIDLLVNEGINVKIRINLDKHNIENSKTLIKELGGRYKGNERIYVYISLLKEDAGSMPIHHSDDEIAQLIRLGYELEEEIKAQGLQTKEDKYLPYLKLSNCMANNTSSIQCAPNGMLGKCEDRIFDHCLGNVNCDVLAINEQNWWCEEEIDKDCELCAFLPYCPHLKNCPLNNHHCDPMIRTKMYNTYQEIMGKKYYEEKQKGNVL